MRLEPIHAADSTRSDRTPSSCNSRGLSTAARIVNPSRLERNTALTATTTAAVTITVSNSSPLIGVENTWKYTRLGFKNRVGGENRVVLPKMSDTSSGSATNTATAETSLAVVFVGAIRRNKKRSRTHPSNGANTTTATRKASHTGTPRSTRTV